MEITLDLNSETKYNPAASCSFHKHLSPELDCLKIKIETIFADPVTPNLHLWST